MLVEFSGGRGTSSPLPPWSFQTYSVVPLSEAHQRGEFACGKDPLDRFIRDQVFNWIGRNLAQVFVLITPTLPDRVLGYYTLSMTRVDASNLPKKVAKRFPHAAEIGAVLLGKLAIDEGLHKQGLGRDLLFDALDRSLAASQNVAAYAMVVDAIDDEATAFYRRFDFEPFPDTPHRLFLPLAMHAKRVAAAQARSR
jgi:GNAT superfamily N-acetyltransferase